MGKEFSFDKVLPAKSKLTKEYPLSKDLLVMSQVWANKNTAIVAAKGAPEAILRICGSDQESKRLIMNEVTAMSEMGCRVLGVAKATAIVDKLANDQTEYGFEFVGLLGFMDPIRSSVPLAVKEALSAGIRVIMITGDYPGTARFIAKKIGLANPDEFITGEQLDAMTNSDLRHRIRTTNVFARVMPEQKLAILNALKANGEITAMTGDGVNDAPALKSAHIGIAMGERGTDVAREASALVLLDDNFTSIVAAVRLGRRIYDNLKRAMGYVLAVHVPIAGMSIIPVALGMPPVLLPAHIAFLELIIDPACSTIFESQKESKNIMKRSPRDLRKPMFDVGTVIISLLQGLGALIASFGLYWFAIKSGHSEAESRSFVFTSLVLSNIAMIVVNLSWIENIFKIMLSANKVLLAVAAGAIGCLLAVLYIPPVASLFNLAPLRLDDVVLIILATITGVLWFEVAKLFMARVENKNAQAS
jgi:Ca2+-transporting ATPase